MTAKFPLLLGKLMLVAILIVGIWTFINYPTMARDAIVGVFEWLGNRAGDAGGFIQRCVDCMANGCS